MARVGIVIRTRDRPYFLERALRDVLDQEFDDWEIVIANDAGAPDAVRAIVDGFGDRLAGRCSVLEVSRPGGRCVAANEGMRAVSAPYVILHDDDDFWDRRFLAETAAWLDEHPADAGVMVPTEIVYEQERDGSYVETRRVPYEPGMTQITLLDLLSVNRAVPISFLYRREIHDEVGFYDETLETVEDWDLYLRIASRRHIGFLVGPPLAFWSQRPTARDAAGNSMFLLADAHRRDDALVRDRALRAYVAEYGLGLPLMIAGMVNDALEKQRRATLWRAVARRLRGRR